MSRQQKRIVNVRFFSGKEIMEENRDELKQNQEMRRGRSRRMMTEPKTKKNLRKFIAAAAVLVVLGAAGGTGYYFTESGKYETSFFPNTVVNGIDVSGKSVDEVKAEIEKGLLNYTLTVAARETEDEAITREEIGLHTEFDGSLEKLLEEQEPGQWIRHIRSVSSHQIDTMLVYDEEKLSERIRALKCMDKTNMREPENAAISEYDAANKCYTILPAKQGTELIGENVKQAVKNAIEGLAENIDLDAEGCYTKPSMEASDESLLTALSEMNRYVSASVTYTFGDENEILDGSVIHTWLGLEGSRPVLDESLAASYVKELAGKRDTAYREKTLKTSYGPVVTITKGNYGWRINQKKETEELLAIVRAGEQKTREPEYLQKAASHGANDYGDTYVEINLTAQHIYFYKDGKLLVESDFVSGNEARGWATPAGAYPLTYKQRNAVLRGVGYATPVSYWMPFNGGIGLHDASWRGSFGGSIYKTGGSHGCINLPPKTAKTIFENIKAGDPVLCYHLSGTESKKSSRAESTKQEPTTAAPETTAPTETPQTTAPAETVPETKPDKPASGAAGPGAENVPTETSPQETPASPIETRPVGPGASAPSGGDKEGIGPGFDTPAPDGTEAPVGPGYEP